ncbi:uncharacterized protein LOC141644363 [Silene latifolia]|uniref:uncharacterized protein LOC141644363 n=1 Tax=Silene latifolia TaxID=37657 RepID=UPI003D786B68
MVVAEGQIVLDKKNDECAENHQAEISGPKKWTLASIEYSVLQYAVSATVDVLFFNKDDEFDLLTEEDEQEMEYRRLKEFDKFDLIHYDRRECEDGVVADVFGSVSAFCNITNEERNPSVSLFSKSLEKAVRVKSGDFIPLSRSLVIVPAYSSSLAVEVNLSLGNIEEPLASGMLEFHPECEWTFKKDLYGKHGRVRVRVTWNHAYDQQLYHEKKVGYQKHVRLSGECHKIDLFSVAVHSKESRDFSFYGTVDANDLNEFCMYSKDESCPQVCPQAGALALLKGPHSRSIRTGDYFSLNVHLKDGTTGGEISDGQAAWDAHLISSWNNRRLCSVIRGDVGFAAVHYSAFSHAHSALVNVKLYGEELPGYVYGKIVARYSTYEYSAAYEKKYFQNTLFDSHSEDDGLQPEAVECGADLPLLKSIVSLPNASNLIIEVDLAVASQPVFDGNVPQTLLKGSVELTRDQRQKQLKAKTFYIELSMSILPRDSLLELLS